MTKFRDDIIDAIATRLSVQQGHGLPAAEGFRHLAEEIVTDIRPIINAEFMRLDDSAPLPSPETNLRVTDEMVEAACAAHWVDPWPGDRSKPALKSARVNMRAALEAALATTEGQPDA